MAVNVEKPHEAANLKEQAKDALKRHSKEPAKEDRCAKDRLPVVNDFVKSETQRIFKLNSILGEGGYGTVYECSPASGDVKKKMACKAEKWSKTVLKIEISVLRAANAKRCKHFCELVDYGRVPNEYMFIIVTLLDRDINRLRNEQPERHFSIGTAARIGMQTCSAIEELHALGFLSRDIKAGNFGIGRREDSCHRLVFMFDFGLSRKFVDKNRNVIPPRKDIGWRGTTRYGSLQAHRKQDLGRRDDMESWLYMLIEISKGHLPWRMVTDRNKVYECKLACREDFRPALLGSLPKQYDEMLTMIDKLTFESQPQYSEYVKMLIQVCEDNSVEMTQPYDWEVEPSPSSVHTSATKSVDNSGSEIIKANNVERPSHPEIIRD